MNHLNLKGRHIYGLSQDQKTTSLYTVHLCVLYDDCNDQQYFSYSELKKYFFMATHFGEPGESGIFLCILYPSDLRHFDLLINCHSTYRHYNSYKNIQQDATVFHYLFYIYIKLNKFRATHRPSSGA
jgi:hypothetical protein